jgi:hypothetical protein
MSVPAEFMQEINAQKVPVSLLGKVMHLWASFPRDERHDFDGRLARVVALVGSEHDGADSPMLAMAAALRLMALDALVMDPAFRAWLITERSPDGITYIHGDLLLIASEQVILEGADGEPAFDSDSFRIRLMELAATRGCA